MVVDLVAIGIIVFIMLVSTISYMLEGHPRPHRDRLLPQEDDGHDDRDQILYRQCYICTYSSIFWLINAPKNQTTFSQRCFSSKKGRIGSKKQAGRRRFVTQFRDSERGDTDWLYGLDKVSKPTPPSPLPGVFPKLTRAEIYGSAQSRKELKGGRKERLSTQRASLLLRSENEALPR